MRRIILLTILVLSFCFAINAQNQIDKNNSQPLKLIAEFKDNGSEWDKLTAHLLHLEFTKQPAAIGIIRLRNDKNLYNWLKQLRKAFAFQSMSFDQIIFILMEKQNNATEVLLAENCSDLLKLEDSLVLRATDIDRIIKLFSPKIIKTKKKN